MENPPNSPSPGGDHDARLPAIRPDPAGRAVALADPRGGALATHYPQSAPQQGDGDEIDLREYWRMLVKRRWWISSAAVAGMVFALLYTLLETPIYRATASVQIQDTTVQVVDVGQTAPVRSYGERGYYETQLELIKSRSLAQRVAADLGLAESGELEQLRPPTVWEKVVAMVSGSPPGEEVAEELSDSRTETQREAAATSAIAGGISTSPVRNSELVQIHFDSPNPAFSLRAANAVAEGFVASNLERRFDSSAYAKTYLEERLQDLKVKLQDSERELVDFAQKEGIVGNREGSATLTEQNLDSVNTALAAARSERVKAETRWRQAQASTGAVVAGMIGAESVIRTLQENRAGLRADYQNKLAVYKPDFPAMLELKGQIDEIDRQIVEEVGSIKSAIKAEYDAALAQEATLAEMLAGMKTEVLDLQSRSIQYNILKREVDTNRELYDGLLQRYKEIGVAAGVSANNLAIVDRASGAFRVKPIPRRNLMFGLLLGVLFGVALALALEYLDDSVKTPDDIESKLHLVNLGAVPLLTKGTSPSAALEDARSGFAESYRSIRTALQFSTESGIPVVLAITSTSPGEGKSTSALALAQNFVQLGKRVLLIDADLRNPSIHRVLGLENGKGLSNCLAGAAKPGEVVHRVGDSTLSVMTSGPLPPNPAELLAGPKFISLLTQASERYDHVVIDAPPVVGLADAPIISNIAHGTLLVVESGRARVGAVQTSIKRLHGARARLLGAVLTKFDAKASAYGYGSYGYSYDYYAYGSAGGAPKRLLGRR